MRTLSPFQRLLAAALLGAVFATFTVAQTAGSPEAVPAAAPAALTEIQYLSGKGPEDAVKWDFFCTAGRNSRVWSTIAVPSCWEQQGFGTYNYGGETVWGDGPIGNEQGLYRRNFTVPAAWKGRTVRLVFDAAMTDTMVWINGQSAGPTHHGGFYRFHYDITPLLHFGEENKIEVTVAKVSAIRSINDAERAADFWIFGGIFRPVWLEALPSEFIDWTGIDAKAGGHFAAEVHLGSALPGATVRARVVDTAGRPVGAPFEAKVDATGLRARVEGELSPVENWTAETPHLYSVTFELRRGAEVLHQVRQRFGFRTIEVRENDGVYLNGSKIVLRGVNRHCFWPETARTVSREQSYADARLIKEGNMNAVRMSHYPPDVDFLEACDELGLYVLDELTGWQHPYHTATGRRLIGELIRRDVNHPSILFWDNGNEGGWNPENDGEFAKWDPQQRAVLHPWETHGGINTKHYPKYDLMKKLSAGPTLFMPTEFLHGLYDGGIGAGLKDYWAVMGNSPTVTGGFFWALVDEGVARTDRGGQIDNAGNLAPDGMVGPHREKEGSFFTVQEIWSPVEVLAPVHGGELPAGWDGRVSLKNHYSFTSLAQCRLEWSLLQFGGPAQAADPAARKVVMSGALQGPGVGPGGEGTIALGLPENWRTGATSAASPGGRAHVDALQLRIIDPIGHTLFTWSWSVPVPVAAASQLAGAQPPSVQNGKRQAAPAARAAIIKNDGNVLTVTAGERSWKFDRTTGYLIGAAEKGQSHALSAGPRVIAFHRIKRSFENVAKADRLVRLDAKVGLDGRAEVTAVYEGNLREVKWLLDDTGAVLDYEYAYEGPVDILGVQFDYPEKQVLAKTWVGRGPYRSYQNRLEGGILDRWSMPYGDPVPGQTYSEPDFKGFFNQWSWVSLDTTEGAVNIENVSGVPYHALYHASQGINDVLQWPPIGLALLDVIPAQGSKFSDPDQHGPQSQTRVVNRTFHGRVRLTMQGASPKAH